MKLRRTVKPSMRAPKKYWKPKNLDFSKICMPDVPKEDRPLVVWSQDYPNFSDTMAFDYDYFSPESFMDDMNSTDRLNPEAIYDCIMAVFESASGNTHVLVKIDNTNLTPRNYKAFYRQIAEKLGANYDKKCCDPFRGFFQPNRVLYTNFDCKKYLYAPSNFLEFSAIQANKYSNCISWGDSNSDIGEFVKGNRNHFIFRTLLTMVKEREDLGDWMEAFAYPYVQEDFTKDEIDRIIAYLRRTDRKYKRLKLLGQIKKDRYEREFGEYRKLLIDGKTHQEACLEVLSDKSVKTQQKYRARYNREFNINEMRGGAIGRSWQWKNKEGAGLCKK